MEKVRFTEDIYASYKNLLFALAYRMMGSVVEAEDIVHEAFLSLQGAEPERITHLKSYLCKIVTNRCIDRLRSAQKQREVYIGPWLPEPLVTDRAGGGSDPYQAYAQHESLSTAYLLLLQQLSWVERAVFLLREVLQYDYEEIAAIVGKSSTNCRQIFHRAKRSIHTDAGRQTAASSASPDHQRLVEQFVSALTSGDMGKLMNILTQDATLFSDGGGKVTAAVRPILGAARITSFLEGVRMKIASDFSCKFVFVGGEPGLVTYSGGAAGSVLSFRIEQGRIAGIYIVVNPDKLTLVR
ncbi:RNA polymerase sigma-70 factor [Paenibacillus rigui]|uniref:RNA polymerase sigma factor SigJ n=1 Tax=Paenibacillus rigui TaxID=554312 RepID=A0A229UTP4_9BACL|nr:RNA polymerase sigma-70 factor [Paenibacillus rigui]OXM86269.1 RNA polymerase sigma factor SigJ [Paenibacillus rigui]